MCKVRDLNKRSRDLANKMGDETIKEARRVFKDFADLIKRYDKLTDKNSKDRETIAKAFAGMQIITLMLCERFEISDEEVLQAGCKIFDEEDED